MKTLKTVGYWFGLVAGSMGLGYGYGLIYNKLLADKLLDK